MPPLLHFTGFSIGGVQKIAYLCISNNNFKIPTL